MVSKFYPAFLMEYKGQTYLESDHGYCTYIILPSAQIYVENIYIAPEYRQTHAASGLLDQAVEIGRQAGCNQLLGTVYMNSPAKDISLLAALKYGFRLLSSNEERLVIVKDIGEQNG